MLCPSNPRELAYKRHYRLPFLFASLLILSGPSASAFGIQSKNTNPLSSSSVVNNYDNRNKKSHSLGVSTTSIPDVILSSPSPPPVVPMKTTFDKGCNFLAERAPGVALSMAIAQLSNAIGKTALGTHVSPLLWATLLGMFYGNLLHQPEGKKALGSGIKFAKGRLLRLGIILYGFKITLQQIAGIGMAGLATDLFMVASTLTLGITVGTKWLKLDDKTATLISSGAAICGCSAVLATQPVVGGESHEVSAAVGTVVLGGTLSMFLYPFLFKMIPCLAASSKLMGVYTGSTIHEIAGVVAAGNAMGGEVAFTAVVTKLARVLLLAPALTTLSWLQNRKCIREAKESGLSVEPGSCKLTLPWFAFGFVAISALNSMVSLPTALVKVASKTSAFSLVAAMAALGIDSDFKAIRSLGSKPLLLAGALWMWLAVGGLGVARLFMGL